MAAIDLRSDTVTRPSPAMRRAMAEAEVGDDVFLEDPTLNLLQERAAAVFGREAALFVPSGSMGNLTSVIAHTRPGQEVICETNGHIYNYEMGALAALAGLLPRVVNGEDGLLSWDAIADAIRPKVYYRPQTSLICLDVAGVSRRHARIVVGETDALLEDLGSKNGTCLADEPLRGCTALREGDRVHIGPIVIIFHASTAGISTETVARRQPRSR